MSNRGGKGFDYRRDYFDNHKGLLGTGLYFCAYCGKPITKKKSHVDHIIPKSKSETMFNRSFNTTIACAKCNQRKSDKVDHRIVQGYASKAVGGLGGILFKPFTLALDLVGKAVSFTLQSIFDILIGMLKLVLGFVMKPLIFIIILAVLYLKFK